MIVLQFGVQHEFMSHQLVINISALHIQTVCTMWTEETVVQEGACAPTPSRRVQRTISWGRQRSGD